MKNRVTNRFLRKLVKTAKFVYVNGFLYTIDWANYATPDKTSVIMFVLSSDREHGLDLTRGDMNNARLMSPEVQAKYTKSLKEIHPGTLLIEVGGVDWVFQFMTLTPVLPD